MDATTPTTTNQPHSNKINFELCVKSFKKCDVSPPWSINKKTAMCKNVQPTCNHFSHINQHKIMFNYPFQLTRRRNRKKGKKAGI